jgi:hypothetical protein
MMKPFTSSRQRPHVWKNRQLSSFSHMDGRRSKDGCASPDQTADVRGQQEKCRTA